MRRGVRLRVVDKKSPEKKLYDVDTVCETG
jgi:hypothetical protein